MSYTEDRNAYTSGSGTVRTAVENFIESIEAQRSLNAFLHVNAESVRAAADASDERFAAGLARPLEGLVVAVKDNISVSGQPLTCASRMLDGFDPLFNATVIEKLSDAGAVFIGKTNMDEFAMGSSNETSAFGIVRNSVDPERVPGGSSGGSAVAVSGGMCHV